MPDWSYFIDEPVLLLGFVAFSLLLAALPVSFWAAGGNKRSSAVTFLVALANIVLAGQLLLRWIQSAHFPISNLYESICFLAWACTFTQLILERIWSSPLIAAATTPFALLSLSFSSFALPSRLQEASPLVPALRSSWLVMHVSVVMCSYAALVVGSLLAFIVILFDRDKELKIRSSSLGSGGYRSSGLNLSSETANQSITLNSINFSRIEIVDTLSYRTITVGFMLLTLGLISGAVWANEAWGSWWSWDPKETWALICWLFYAAYLHTRLTKGWQGRRSAILAIGGLFLISICYIGVNLLGVGLHSYGWFFS